MPRLVIISNRLPITITEQDGKLQYKPSAGGLATGLNSLGDSIERIWIGWPGIDIQSEEKKEGVREDLLEHDLIPVFLSQQEIQLYYEGFSNKTIWPHFHYFTQYTAYEDHMWEAYQRVNQKFAEAVIPHIREDDLVWVHDYQLMLLPNMIRQEFPDISIGFFLHIPFPSYEIFRILPWRKQILEGILGANLIGFHTFGYMRHFLSAAYRITGHEHNFGHLKIGNRLVNVDVFPMGIDYEKYAHPEFNLLEENAAFKIKQLAKGNKLVISIDRLDYSKGIPNRIKVMEAFLDRYPEYIGKVILVMVVVPSRANVDEYQDLKHQIDTLVGEVNGRFRTFDWAPIRYFYRSLNFEELMTLYQEADIAMITPLRDGMNLVAKEYVASKEDSKKGVLILSEMAGSSSDLHDAITVNPQRFKRHRRCTQASHRNE
jgi:trehalose 6-phosphate synthase/phosphatase